MRCDQPMGLSCGAEAYLAKNAIHNQHELFINGKIDKEWTEPKKEQIDRVYYGMFGTEYPLHRYQKKDRSFIYEYVQSDPWSSGPVIFLALRDRDGKPIKESLWDQEEIDNA